MDQRQALLLSRTQASYVNLVAATRDQVGLFIANRWEGLGNYRDADFIAYENAVIPVVLSGERRVAQLTNSYLAGMQNIATGKNAAAPPLDIEAVTGAPLRQGVEPSTVYHRPAVTMYSALSKGTPFVTAAKQGLARARNLASTDLQLAKTHTVARQGRYAWYRRRLTGAENCALCVIASTQRYHQGDLQPIHPACDCYCQEENTQDPGQIIEPDLLDATHGAIASFTGTGSDRSARIIDGHGKSITLRDGSSKAADYTDLVVTRQHGEYGPVIGWRDDAFTSAADLGL
ncbi:hypothetical protein [Cryobacterium cryoconiti]|uniref:Phage head morphogenesis domain-containing protein n=1 Tax=Cryobacterium cryoconiti TaxID=1259239 RepID=A0A4Y8JSS0_9MICO|nr:hypothetical protein [Cryobacterium cryoconiti]TFD27513.1 hypothetical protein E3T49_13305 [Cryobacterium cryoconiti]